MKRLLPLAAGIALLGIGAAVLIGDGSSDAPVDAAGVAEVAAGSTGRHRLFLALEYSGPGFRNSHHLAAAVSPRRCEVPEGGGVVRVEVDHQVIRAGVQRMQEDD